MSIQSFSADRMYYVTIYGSLILGILVLTVVNSINFYNACNKSGTTIHNRMVSSLLRAPIEFFDSTPTGRILNKLTRDLVKIDDVLPRIMGEVISTSLSTIGVFIITTWSNYYVVLPSLIFLLVLYCLQRVYGRKSQVINRLEANGMVYCIRVK